MRKDNNKPKLRFPGFTDPWEQRKLGELLMQRKILQKISDDAPLLAFASGQGVIDRSERKSNNRDQLTLDPTNKIYLLTEYNDIVYNPSNLKYGAIDRNKHGKGVISPIYVTFITDEEPSFIELIVKSEKFRLRALQFEEGTVVKRQSVKPENLLTLDAKISQSHEEQRKIGMFFEQLDHFITLNQRKLNHLQDKKKSLLQKMFPKNGEDFPELRFSGFTDPWEQRKVGEFLTESRISGTTGLEAKKLTVKLWSKGIVPKEEVYQGSEATKYYIRKEGQFMYGKLDFLNQAFGIVPPELNGYESTLDSPAFDIYKGLNSKFFLEYVSRKSFYQYQGNLANGSRKAKRIHVDKFFDMPLVIPSKEEQDKIGAFFANMDNLIALHQRKLNHLQEQKKALLQQMFV